MKIGVSGASGHLGRAVVSELLQRPDGHEVVAITRTPETVSGPAQGRFGDYNRPESLAEAYAGLDRLVIISTVDQEPGKRGASLRTDGALAYRDLDECLALVEDYVEVVTRFRVIGYLGQL
jgi:uncharacterized protein YbjT (DUF2867 family)